MIWNKPGSLVKRQNDLQSKSQQDNLGDVFELLETFIELDDVKATRQIVYHLNREADRPVGRSTCRTVPGRARDLVIRRCGKKGHGANYLSGDIRHLRDSYLFRRVLEWADRPESDDPLLKVWLLGMESKIGESDAAN